MNTNKTQAPLPAVRFPTRNQIEILGSLQDFDKDVVNNAEDAANPFEFTISVMENRFRNEPAPHYTSFQKSNDKLYFLESAMHIYSKCKQRVMVDEKVNAFKSKKIEEGDLVKVMDAKQIAKIFSDLRSIENPKEYAFENVDVSDEMLFHLSSDEWYRVGGIDEDGDINLKLFNGTYPRSIITEHACMSTKNASV
ncbi:MAG: hypothetical protein COB67_02335 [SAR324 cluster bacterium]|uniref:Uncharacterized protein n=1 Tax=SAR324 cluster bacterium TaxID=2024889 RepID=A0A2A4T9B3_9DELT|nr:MAG: hypothetical protein COB67_02335 [SAR324 cluster bacterium]